VKRHLLLAVLLVSGALAPADVALAQEKDWAMLEHEALVLSARGRDAEALPLALEAARLAEETLGPEDPAVTRILYNVARIRESQGEYEAAETIRKRILDVEEKALGPTATMLLYPLMNLAGNYMDQKKYAMAEPLYERLMRIQEGFYGRDSLELITPLNALATLYRAQGRLDEAEARLRRALRLWEKTEGPSHPGFATSLENVASLLMVQGRYAEAEPLYRRALGINEAAFENGEPTEPRYHALAASLDKSAALFRKTNRDAQARVLEERVASLRTKFHPEPLLRIPANWGQRQP
jgi:tetratricopeptide (TPR) repeat protein